MPSPIDLLTAGQDAVIAMLRAQLPPDKRSMVRHSLKEGATPPFHLVGDIESEDIGSKGDQVERLTVDVHTVYRGTDRRELLSLMHDVHLAVPTGAFNSGGASFRIRWVGAGASPAAGDGVTYAGVTTLEITAEPA